MKAAVCLTSCVRSSAADVKLGWQITQMPCCAWAVSIRSVTQILTGLTWRRQQGHVHPAENFTGSWLPPTLFSAFKYLLLIFRFPRFYFDSEMMSGFISCWQCWQVRHNGIPLWPRMSEISPQPDLSCNVFG